MTCEKKHKKVKFEEKRPEGTCGGEMDEAKSESGTVYGCVCRTCGAGKKVCEGCGDLFTDLKRHYYDSKGDVRDNGCLDRSPIYRRMAAAADFGKYEGL